MTIHRTAILVALLITAVALSACNDSTGKSGESSLEHEGGSPALWELACKRSAIMLALANPDSGEDFLDEEELGQCLQGLRSEPPEFTDRMAICGLIAGSIDALEECTFVVPFEERLKKQGGLEVKIVLDPDSPACGRTRPSLEETREIIEKRLRTLGATGDITVTPPNTLTLRWAGIEQKTWDDYFQKTLLPEGGRCLIAANAAQECPAVDSDGMARHMQEWNKEAGAFGEVTKVERNGVNTIQAKDPDSLEEFRKTLEPSVAQALKLVIVNAPAGEESGRPIYALACVGKTRMVLTDVLKDAQVHYGEDNRPYVSVALTTEGAKRFGEVTTEMVGQRLVLWYSSEIVVDAVVSEGITGGRFQISLGNGAGHHLYQNARKMVLTLTSGYFPVFTIESVSEIEPQG